MKGEISALSADELLFFRDSAGSLPIYLSFREQMLDRWPSMDIRVARTQISFYLKTMVCCASLLPLRRKKEQPDAYLVITFGLDIPFDGPEVDAVVQVSHHRWTHHVMLESPEEMDDAFWALIRRAAEFSERKRRGKGV